MRQPANKSSIEDSRMAPTLLNRKDDREFGSSPKASPSGGVAKVTAQGTTAWGTIDYPPSNISEALGPVGSGSSVRSVEFSPAGPQGLAKSDSNASAGHSSIKSHISVAAIGTIPYDSLQGHGLSDSSSGMLPTGNNMPRTVPETVPLPPSKCLANGDIFLLLDLPDESMVGHDAMAMTVSGTNLTGIRDIPPGAHLLWVSDPNGTFRFGYWYVAKGSGVVRMKQWNRFSEFLGEPTNRVEVHDKKESIDSIYKELVPHGYSEYRSQNSVPPPPPPKDNPKHCANVEPHFAANSVLIWHQITSSISRTFLESVTRRGDIGEWLVQTTDTANVELLSREANRLFGAGTDAQLTFLFPGDDSSIYIPTSVSESAAGGVQDITAYVTSVLNNTSLGITIIDMIAELQFTFVTGMHLGNHACIQQWCYLLLKVILRAHRLVVTHPSLCRGWLQTLHAQMIYDKQYLSQLEGADKIIDDANTGILAIIPGTKAKLHKALTVYKRRLNEELLSLGDKITQDQAAAGHAFAGLEAWFWRHGWDLRSDCTLAGKHHADSRVGDDSDEEYTPVVVQLDETGREIGLVSWAKD